MEWEESHQNKGCSPHLFQFFHPRIDTTRSGRVLEVAGEEILFASTKAVLYEQSAMCQLLFLSNIRLDRFCPASFINDLGQTSKVKKDH